LNGHTNLGKGDLATRQGFRLVDCSEYACSGCGIKLGNSHQLKLLIPKGSGEGINTHRLVNAVKFPIEGGRGPVKLFEEKSLIKKVD
jgi:hypothetical protein